MSVIHNVFAAIGNFWVRAGRARLRHNLLLRDERFLADAGFSRALLEVGVDAYPWRKDQEHTLAAMARPRSDAVRAMEAAIAELSEYSDRQLADLDISRDAIREVVYNGRPTVEHASKRPTEAA